MLLRGHLPGNGAELLEKPMDVKAGLFQYRPDRRTRVFGQHPAAPKRHVFIKAQALRLVEDRMGLAGSWSALHMVETPPGILKELPLCESLPPGDRLGVLLLLPGGSVLCDLLVFERTLEGQGWKLIVTEETRARTDSSMPKGSERGNPQPWICKRRPFVRIDSAVIDARFAHLLTDAERKASPDVAANRKITSWTGRVRTDLGDTAYKQVASRLERLLSWNRCSAVLIAGGGFLRGQTRLQHPFQRFYSLRDHSGYLFNVLNRLGLPWEATTGKPGRLWMKPYLENPINAGELRVGHVFRQLRKDELAVSVGEQPITTTTRGSVTHISREADGKHAVDYPVNAAWGVLLAWADPVFKKLAEKALAASPPPDGAL